MNDNLEQSQPTDSKHTNGWNEYSRLVLAELERHNKLLEEYNKKLNVIQVEIAMLKVKAGIWGALGGVLAAAFAILSRFLS